MDIMTNKYMKVVAVMAFAVTTLTVAAQTTESAYFTEGHLYRHDLNPAIGNDKNYIAMPALGNIGVGMQGNVGLKNFFFQKEGQLVTFMHPSVSKEEFMKDIKDKNSTREDFRLQLLGAGFKGFGGYNTIEINTRVQAGVNVSGSILDLTKSGLTNKKYDVGPAKVKTNAFAEIALGHSRNLNDQWRIGAKVKFLLGLANVSGGLEESYVDFATDGYRAHLVGSFDARMKNLKITEENGKVEDVDVDKFGLNGFGLALDLGAEYKLNDTWKFSASVQDLGFISWNEGSKIGVDATVNTNDYSFDVEQEKESFSETIDRIGEDLKLRKLGDGGSTTSLAATLNFAAEYRAPFYEKLTFGLMNTTRINGEFSWTNFRLSANVAPIKQISAGINLSAGTYGVGFGWIVDFHPRGFGLFLAMDNTIGKLSKQGIPLNNNAEFSMGINFPF